MAAVADEAFDRIAGLVRQVLRVPVGLVSLVDRDGQVFPGQSGLGEPWSDTRCTPLTHSFCQYVVLTAEPLIVSDARLDPVLRDNLAIPDLGVVAYAGIPLIDEDGAAVGSLCAIDTEPRDWTAEEVALLSDLAAACSAELQLRSAADRARLAQSRTAMLLELSETLSGTLTTADISQAVSRLSRERLGAQFGGIAVLDVGGEELTYVDLVALPGPVDAEYRSFPLSRRTPSSSVVRDGQALFFEDLGQMAAGYPEAAAIAADSGGGSAAYLPMQGTAERIVGSLGILWPTARTFDVGEQALLNGLSRYAAQAVERALLLSDRREVAETLQAAMLPSLPEVAGLELTGRYLPARIGNAVGGDWYDAFPLPGGQVAISVGDVQGHDTRAAAAMGQVRSTLRGLTLTLSRSPAEVFTALDTVLSSLRLGRFATGILGTVARTPEGAVLEWSNAGHPPGLVLVPGRPPAFLSAPAELPLGLRFAIGPRQSHRTALAPGSILVLFTDGLVERRGVDLDSTLELLAASADRHRARPLADLADAVLHDLVRERPDDDVVLFCVRVLAAD